MGKLLTNHDNNKINQQIIKNQHYQQAMKENQNKQIKLNTKTKKESKRLLIN